MLSTSRLATWRWLRGHPTPRGVDVYVIRYRREDEAGVSGGWDKLPGDRHSTAYAVFVLWGERKRLAELAEREAAGESLWTDNIDAAARTKLQHALETSTTTERAEQLVAGTVEDVLLYDLGLNPIGDVSYRLRNANTDTVLSALEATAQTLRDYSEDPPTHHKWGPTEAEEYSPDFFERRANDVFNAHRVAFRLVDGEIVPFSSDEMHVSVVEPTLRLLIARPNFDKAHDAYLAALKEISKDEAANAITDAGRALQEALVALGCQGNALGPLITDARKRGVLAAHDQKLIDGIERFLHWASAERSQTGDAHKHSDATLDDAWLMVHVVGALVLRLADATPRG